MQLNAERGTECDGRSSVVHSRVEDSNRGRLTREQDNVQNAERSPMYVRCRSPRVENLHRRSATPTNMGNDREYYMCTFEVCM